MIVTSMILYVLIALSWTGLCLCLYDCRVPPDGEFPVMNYHMTQEFKPPFRINTLIEEAGALKNPSESQRSVSLSKFSERRANDSEQYSTKSKRLFKALLSMRKPRKDQKLYNYLDEI